MIGIDHFLQQLREDEGLRLRPYRCSENKLTIGYGRNLEDNGISEEEAEIFLLNDAKAAYRDLEANLPWMGNLPSKKQGILLNMCFNMGITRLLGFRKMIAKLIINDYVGAAEEMKDSRWYHQVGPRARRLVSLMSDGKIT
jgi:lysozyme